MLDVAGGTGIVSRALADRVARAVVVDSTPAMLEEGRRHAAAERLTNLQYVRGAVANLPFADTTFSLVFARFLLHHLIQPGQALTEMVRVCRPGGRVVVMDLAASTDPVIAERQDQMERLRDPSHVRMPARGVVRRWLQAHGLLIDGVAEKEIDRPVLPWLEQAVTDRVGRCPGMRGLRRPSSPVARGPGCARTAVPTVRCGSANCGQITAAHKA